MTCFLGIGTRFQLHGFERDVAADGLISAADAW